MKCDRCSCEIDSGYLRYSKGYCKECGTTLVDRAIEDYNSATEEGKQEFRDRVAAEMLSRNIA
jgi:hypothetical protein